MTARNLKWETDGRYDEKKPDHAELYLSLEGGVQFDDPRTKPLCVCLFFKHSVLKYLLTALAPKVTFVSSEAKVVSSRIVGFQTPYWDIVRVVTELIKSTSSALQEIYEIF